MIPTLIYIQFLKIFFWSQSRYSFQSFFSDKKSPKKGFTLLSRLGHHRSNQKIYYI